MNALVDHAWGISPATDRVWAQVVGLRATQASGRQFLVLQAYIDDSRDGEDGFFVLAGYVASAESWAAFSREWEAMLPLSTIQPDGTYRFKMSEMAQSPERMSRVPGFHTIINKYVDMSIAMVMDVGDLRRAIDRVHATNPNIDWNINLELDHGDWSSPFYMAFRGLMDNFHRCRLSEHLMSEALGDQPVDFYFDESTEKEAVFRVWDEYLSKRHPDQQPLYGATPRFEKDEIFLPIQAADFRAWWVRKWAREVGRAGMAEAKFPFETAAKKITNMIFWATEDEMAEAILDSAQQSTPSGWRVEDRLQRNDPPAPLVRLASYVTKKARQLWRTPRG